MTLRRLPLMALAGLSLLLGLWGGLIRFGWPLPHLTMTLPLNHGPLMVTGFLGTVIGLERAVALKRRWPYGAPLFAGVGGLAQLVGVSPHVGHILTAVGSVFLISIFVFLYRWQPAVYLATMGAGAFLWLVGTMLWYGGDPLYRVVPWWIGFLVLTVAGERLELSRLMRLSAWSRAGFLLATGVFLLGLLAGRFQPATGNGLSGIGLGALAAWLLGHDGHAGRVASRAISQRVSSPAMSGSGWGASCGCLSMIALPPVPLMTPCSTPSFWVSSSP